MANPPNKKLTGKYPRCYRRKRLRRWAQARLKAS
jgi:hypothetical protein